MKIKNIDFIERENILKEAEILEIVSSKGITFDSLKNLNTKDLKNLFGENIYQSYLNFLRDTKNGAITKENIELFKSKLSSILDNFFDKNTHQNIGENLKNRQIGLEEIYFEEINEKKFKEDLRNIRIFKKYTTEKIEGLNFKQIFDGYLNHILGIKKYKERKKYYSIIIKLLEKFKIGEINDLKTLNELFKQEKEKIDNLRNIKKKEIPKKSYSYFGNSFDEEKFKKDLKNIKKFTTVKSTEKIEGLSFKQIYDGYLNHILKINVYERKNYYSIIIKLLEKFKNGEINDLKTLNELFKQEKIKIDELKEIKKKEFKIKSYDYFGENFNEEKFKKDLEKIEYFKTTNTTEKIEGLNFLQIFAGYLNYKLGIKKSSDRQKYYKAIVKLLEKFKNGSIKDLKTLNELFKQEKIKIDKVKEFNKKEFKIKSYDYFGDNFDEEKFKKDLKKFKYLKTTNTTDKMEGLNFKQIYDGYLNYKLGIKKSTDRQRYHGIIVRLLEKFKNGTIKDLKTLNELFEQEKVKVVSLKEKQKISEKYFGINFKEEKFKKDLDNIIKFKNNNKTDKIEGLSFLEIIDGYLNYRLGLKSYTKRRIYYSSIIKLLEKFKKGIITNLKDIDKLYLNIN